ncbi:MAG: hypothetical protein K2H81_06095, partial [Alistipes sp.]|nr:hypothetical protein [Alistipes sp.]
MKKSLHFKIFYVSLVILSSCSEFDADYNKNIPIVSKPISSFHYDNIVYYPETNSYIAPQNDPYTIENFQKAYNKLINGHSEHILPRSQINEFSEMPKLKATHYALKIFPKNEEEQWKVELTKDIKVSYIPFNYVQLSEEDMEKATLKKSQIPIY